ncbi:phospholipase C, phosphocholine-specific [Arsenicicoccus piscis]|uniref:phospholipase C n=1 Tax=Arsenicicoccus piscis TaxID=673954 RepID=A0ABQ6HM41_9MICO|nr:phospholipase C, phosphocholine-specific [Arsenicicoccus piscis]MCH8626926.1 phospholipase C, phosphocholine-specific [Arsenicicoccus piscis]GMA19158.1 phospholipase C, phosphocholine-specific [Arsenicicoccus piscis]
MPTPPHQPDRNWSTIDRRRFLQVAGATTAMTLLSESIAHAASIPANRRTGSIKDVEHVIVLMQENRGFDHYLASMRGVRGFGDPHPAILPSGKTVWHQSDGTRDILPFRPDVDALGLAFLEGLPHSWKDGQAAVNRGRYDQWVPNKGTTTMAYLERKDAAFHYQLADAFTVCDAYHCSFIGNTDPNRYYLWSGWTGNDGKGGGPVLYNDELGYDWTTYPERLEQAGVSWKVYQDEGNGLDAAGSWGWTEDAYIGNYGDNSLLYFNRYRNAGPGDALYEKARRGTSARTGDDYFRILREDVQADRLPSVSYIAAPEAFSEHGNWPTAYGAWYIAKVLDSLTSNPEVWSKTALFITYDENDGLFDHLVPPLPACPVIAGESTVSTEHEFYPGKPGDAGYAPGPFGAAPRVPMFVVSPWSTGGWVCSEAFDHTSIIRYMERRFGVREPQITPWRRAVFGDLTSAFDFNKVPAKAPRMMTVDAFAPKDRLRHPSYKPVPPAAGTMPHQEPGTRPARPIGYDLRVDEQSTKDALTVTIRNAGDLGATLQARLLSPAGDPHSYTVEAGRSLTASLPVTGAYAVDLHGPNGFFRGFAGDRSSDAVEISLEPRGRSGQLHLTVTRAGREVDVEVVSAYGGALRDEHGRVAGRCHDRGRGKARTRSLVQVDTRGTGGWYDLTVTVPGTSFRRVLAGHLENGRPSISDPQLGR